MQERKPPRAKALPLDFHKVVEARRRSRIDRARQLSMNVEMQKHILHTTELYNLDAERQRLKVALATSLGAPLARVVHDAQMDAIMRSAEDDAREAREAAAREAQRAEVEARLARMTSRVAELETTSVPLMPAGGRRRARRQSPGNAAQPVVTLDRYAR